MHRDNLKRKARSLRGVLYCKNGYELLQRAQQPAQHADVMLPEQKSSGSACCSWAVMIHHGVFDHTLLVSEPRAVKAPPEVSDMILQKPSSVGVKYIEHVVWVSRLRQKFCLSPEMNDRATSIASWSPVSSAALKAIYVMARAQSKSESGCYDRFCLLLPLYHSLPPRLYDVPDPVRLHCISLHLQPHQAEQVVDLGTASAG